MRKQELCRVVVIVEEKEKALKIGNMTLHAKLFGHHKNEMP